MITQSQPPAQTASALLIDFTQTAEKIGGTPKRLEKAAFLGEYLKTLNDDDLLHAARFFAGYAFSLRDQRNTNVGGAALLAAMLAVTGADEIALRERLVILGDAGDAAFEFFSASPNANLDPSLTLSFLADALANLAETSGTKKKIELVIALLQRATPLEAKYIVKLLQGDLRIGLKEGAVEDGIARLASVSVSQIQWVNMLTGDIGETALLARHGKLDQAQMLLMHPIKFMLASPANDLTEVQKQFLGAFAVEDKFDGIRAQAHILKPLSGDENAHGQPIEGRRVALFSRTLDEITRSFPDLLSPLASLLDLNDPDSDGLILDGEIVPVLGDKILPFQDLQQRLNRKTLSEELLQRVPVAFIAYDLLYARGEVFIEKPFTERRGQLETLPFNHTSTRLGISAVHEGIDKLDEEFEAARARGNEGLMVKDLSATYKPGRRGKEWLKIKRALATLDVVVTAVEVGSGRRGKFLSDYTFAVRASETDPTLLNVGKAYSGLTDAEIAELSEWFKAHTLQSFAHGKVRVVEPQIVLEITFDRVQPSARHKSGYALRFPRILRLRTDKPPAEIDTLETVRLLAEGEARSDD